MPLFFRVEHPEYFNFDLAKYLKNNNIEVTDIYCGPWSCLDLFSPEESEYMASISINHALPYYKENRPFDKEINDIVMGPKGKSDPEIKEHFLYGCGAKHLINRYFPIKLREIFHSHGFHVGVYSSNFIHTSKFQSIMNIDKPFEYIGSYNIV